MHSSGMRTARLLPVSPNKHCLGVYLPGGYLTRYSPRGQTDTCKNITFQTSFAGGKNLQQRHPSSFINLMLPEKRSGFLSDRMQGVNEDIPHADIQTFMSVLYTLFAPLLLSLFREYSDIYTASQRF